MNLKERDKEGRCEFYEHWQWCEPPLEPGDNGTIINEWECKNANGYFVASCLGKIKNCHLPKYQAKDKKYCEVQDEPKTTRGESD